MPIIPILMGLAQVVPSIVGMLAGEKAGQKAEAVAGMVKAITGQDDVGAGVQAINARPELALQLQTAIMQHERESYIAETARLEVVNETARAELASGDAYARRWRPTFGYIAAATWLIQGVVVFGVMAYVVIYEPARIGVTLRAITELLHALADHWMYALAVLGIAVWKRSDDKRVAAAGQSDVGVLGAIAAKIRGK